MSPSTATAQALPLTEVAIPVGSGVHSDRVSRVKQGYRVELDPTIEQRARLGRHAGLSRVVENFCLDLVKAALDQRDAERTYGVPKAMLTPVPWSAPELEKAWRVAHPTRYPWFTEAGLSSRVPKEACRGRAAGLKNWAASRKGARRGRRVGFPTWRKRKPQRGPEPPGRYARSRLTGV